MDPLRNFAFGTLVSGINSSAASLTVASGQGTRFPSSGSFNVIVWNSSDYASPSLAYYNNQAEIVRVTSRVGDVMNITRAQEGTAAVNLNNVGKTYTVSQTITSKTFDDIDTAIAAGGGGTAAPASFEKFVATSGQTVITLAGVVASDAIVAVNGVMQTTGDDYGVSGNTLTFTSPLEQGDDIMVIYSVSLGTAPTVVADGIYVTGLPVSGSATDSTPAINAALTYAATNGIGLVVLPLGVYRIYSAFTIPAGITLKGSGDKGTTLLANLDTLQDWIQLSSNTHLTNLVVDAAYVTGGTADITYAPIRIRTSSATPISNVRLSDLTIKNCRQVGLKIFGNVKKVDITNVAFNNFYLASHVVSDTYSPEDITYSFCRVIDSWGTVSSAQSGAFKFSGETASGLSFKVGKGPKRVNVFNCFIENAGQMGTEYWHYAGGMYRGNTVKDVGFGISSAQAGELQIVANTFRRCNSYCIELNAPSGPVYSSGNLCNNLLADEVTKGPGAGISFNADYGVGEKCISDGDTIINCGTAVSFFTSKGSVLRNFTIDDCNLGLDINSCSDVLIQKGNLRGTIDDAVWLKTSNSGSTDVTIEDVRFECTSQWGFRVSATAGRIYRNLVIRNCDTTKMVATSGGHLFFNFADADLVDSFIGDNVPLYATTVNGVVLPRIDEKKLGIVDVVPFTYKFGAHANATNTNQTQTSQVKVPIAFDVTDTQYQIVNWARVGGTVQPNSNTITVKCALMVNGTRYPITINGLRTVTLDKGACVWTDPCGLLLKPSDTVYFLLYSDAGASGFTPMNRGLRGTGAGYVDSWISGADYTDAGTFPAVSLPNGYTFQACKGRPMSTYARAVTVVGDSVANGAGDTQTNTGRPGASHDSAVGYFGRACQGGSVPMINVSVGGDRLATFLTQRHLRSESLKVTKTVLCNYATNDIFSAGTDLATMKANFLAFCAWLKVINPGVSLYWATCTYQTSSTDGWLTETNQTVANSTYKTVVDNWNAYLKDTSASGARIESGGLLKGVFDVSTVCCNPTTGKWRDGVLAHTSALASATINSVTLSVATSSSRLYDSNGVIKIISGTGAGQVRRINAHSSSTVLSVMDDWTTTPDATSVVEIWETFTQDGTHPTYKGHLDASAIINPRMFEI